jgi:arsenate reductase
MAEGWARALHPNTLEVASAGTRPSAVHPLAVEVMREAGVDISAHVSKSVDRFLGQRFDHVITLCGDAAETCPVFPGSMSRAHFDFDDPARATGSREEVLRVFRRVRDEIRALVEHLPALVLAPAVPRGSE